MKTPLCLVLLLVTIRAFAGEQNVNVDRVGGTQVGTTVPVSGTVTTTPPSNASTNVTQFGGTNVVTGTGASGAGILRVTTSNDSQVKPWDGTNTVTVKAASTAAAAADTALVVAVSPNGSNPCHNPAATLNSLNVSLSGTTATQVVAISGSTKIYLCAMVVGWGGGTSPTFSLEYGTGTNCATGTTVVIPATAISTGTPNSPAYPNDFFVTPGGQALCYILTGTSPTGKLIASYVQQ